MIKQFATLVDVCDNIMPTWLTWNLLAVAPAEKCQELNNQGISKYRISDGRQIIEVWMLFRPEGYYQRASVELENELDNLYCRSQPLRSQSVVANSPRTDSRKNVVKPTVFH